MKWTTLTYDFDKSKKIYKVRFDTAGSDLPSSISQVAFFAESPNINCDGMSWSSLTGASASITYAYAGQNRFGVRDKIFCNHYYNFTNEYWTAHTHTTAISATVSEFDSPVVLYYAGATAYNDATFQTVLAEKVSVYVDASFELDKESVSFNYNSGITTVGLTSESSWTASTNDSWITLSQYTGLTSATITVTVANNYNHPQRTGTVSFTDGVDILTLTVTQNKDSRVFLKNIFFEDKKAKMIIRNNEVIYRMLVKPIFSVDTDNIDFESTGGTDTFNITANDSWSMTIPNFVTVSSLTGYGNTTITVTTTGETSDTELTGNIVITCGNKTHTIAVTQQSSTPSYDNKYLTFVIISAGTICWKTNSSNASKTISYSKDNGVSWTNITSTTDGVTINVNAGDKVQFKGDNSKYTNNSFSEYSSFNGTTCKFNLYGNIMSLITSTEYATTTTLNGTYVFCNLFNGCTGLTYIIGLTLGATDLIGTDSFSWFFQSCTGLVDASGLILPATALTSYCYRDMFLGCTSLTTVPDLPATTLAQGCYDSMFRNCTSLTTVPSLPATTLANSCYMQMFEGCTSLTTAPELPATTLINYCYDSMFRECTSLTTAPILPALTLGYCSYRTMFYGCRMLNYIKCLATDISETQCTYNWVQGVASSGTFVKAAGVSWPSGTDGIPSGWTVQEE